ncbi:DUF6735 family protein [Natronococcus roseus]|uniref:DUF6735 family protein n=1 Tax=Natronococcus roseus TaxID=1052014 RepID=UPI00374D5260
MSHGANVAFQVDDGEYDIYYSHNGAQDLQLRDVLIEEVDDSNGYVDPHSLGSIEPLPQLSKCPSEYTKADGSAIDSNPLAQRVPLQALGYSVDFADAEAVYVVRSGRVETYYPVWLFPNVVRPWRDHLTVEVYKSGNIVDGPMDLFDKIESMEPLRTIDGETLSGDIFDDTIVERVVRDEHANVYALWSKMVSESDDDEPDLRAVLQTSAYTVHITVDGDVNSFPEKNGGMFVEIGQMSQREIELEAAALRFNIGMRLNALRHEPTDEELAEAAAEASIEAYQSFGDDIASFSPAPYGQMYRAVEKVGGVSTDSAPELSKFFQ